MCVCEGGAQGSHNDGPGLLGEGLGRYLEGISLGSIQGCAQSLERSPGLLVAQLSLWLCLVQPEG